VNIRWRRLLHLRTANSIFLLSTLICVQVRAADHFKEPKSEPLLHIQIVLTPSDRAKPIQVNFEFASKGKTPVAVLRDQLYFDIGNDQKPHAFRGTALYATNSPTVFTVPAKSLMNLSATTISNKLTGDAMSKLPAGMYKLRVCIEQRKDREADYQWTQEVCSDSYDLSLK
jgi:hypothetical protein